MTDDAPLPDLFSSCALWAWLTVAAETGQQPPDSERTRRLAYDLYEAELRRKTPPAGVV